MVDMHQFSPLRAVRDACACGEHDDMWANNREDRVSRSGIHRRSELAHIPRRNERRRRGGDDDDWDFAPCASPFSSVGIYTRHWDGYTQVLLLAALESTIER